MGQTFTGQLSDKYYIISLQIAIIFVQFASETTPVAAEFRVVPKVNNPVIFGMSWFAELNSQIDWHTHSVSLDLDAEQDTIVTAYTADSFSSIDLCTAD